MQGSLLVLETSCASSSIVAWVNGEVAACAEWQAQRNHASAIFKPLQQVLESIKEHAPQEILVGSGPGSYGGVRVALAVADGLALAYGGRVTSFCSWNGLGIEQAEAWVISDARRGGWAWGRLINGVMNAAPEILSAERSAERLAECAAAGIPVYSTEEPEKLSASGMGSIPALVPHAAALGKLWLSMSEAEKAPFRERPAEPVYVRPPHITNSKRPAWAVKA